MQEIANFYLQEDNSMWPFNNKQTPGAATSAQSSKPTISLEKSKVVLDKTIVNLSKKSGIDLNVHQARVAVVMDKSGSMDSNFYRGEDQAMLTRLLPLALKFDDNGELEVFVFDTRCQPINPSMTISNFETYVNTQIINKGYGPLGGTSYAPVIRTTMEEMDCENKSNTLPTFVIVITDGENDDKSQTDDAIRKSSEFPIFYQFIGIGSARFDYLQELDNLSGRKVDNTAFISCRDIASMSDDELYAKLLEQYPQWLKDMHFI